jgi:hypothetical protein
MTTNKTIARYILEPGEEAKMCTKPVDSATVKIGTYLLQMGSEQNYLFICEYTINKMTKNMNEHMWAYAEMEDIPNELKIYTLLL